jgi:toxin ParE1/3/4
MPRLDIHRLANAESLDAYDRYDQTSTRNAKKFYAELDRIFDNIVVNPAFYGWYDDEFRFAILRKYPYAVIYRERSEDVVQVIAVAHTSREPGYWKDRV